MAILVSLGATRKKAISTYLAQLGLLGLIAAVPSIIAAFFCLPLLSAAISGIASDEVEVFMSLRSISMAFVVAVFAGWVIALPSLRKLARLNPLCPFSGGLSPRVSKSQVGLPLFHSGNSCLLGGLTLLQSDSWKLANLFFVALLVSSVLLYLVSIPGLWFLKWAFRNSSLPLRLASRSLARNQSSSITGFLALGLGVLLLSLIPSSSTAWKMKSGPTIQRASFPSFSLQHSGKRRRFASRNARFGKEALQNLTPWVRGKLLKVKGENYEK